MLFVIHGHNSILRFGSHVVGFSHPNKCIYPNQHLIRFGHGIPMREPTLEIERVPLEARIEKRLGGLLGGLAQHKNMTVGEMLEKMSLHSFEKVSGGGVASPHTEKTLAYIQELREKHGIDYDTHASYRFKEKPDAG